MGKQTNSPALKEEVKGYYHVPCGKTFELYVAPGAGPSYMTHQCPGITPYALLHPGWFALAKAVHAQSERLLAEGKAA